MDVLSEHWHVLGMSMVFDEGERSASGSPRDSSSVKEHHGFYLDQITGCMDPRHSLRERKEMQGLRPLAPLSCL